MYGDIWHLFDEDGFSTPTLNPLLENLIYSGGFELELLQEAREHTNIFDDNDLLVKINNIVNHEYELGVKQKAENLREYFAEISHSPHKSQLDALIVYSSQELFNRHSSQFRDVMQTQNWMLTYSEEFKENVAKLGFLQSITLPNLESIDHVWVYGGSYGAMKSRIEFFIEHDLNNFYYKEGYFLSGNRKLSKTLDALNNQDFLETLNARLSSLIQEDKEYYENDLAELLNKDFFNSRFTVINDEVESYKPTTQSTLQTLFNLLDEEINIPRKVLLLSCQPYVSRQLLLADKTFNLHNDAGIDFYAIGPAYSGEITRLSSETAAFILELYLFKNNIKIGNIPELLYNTRKIWREEQTEFGIN